MKSTYSITERQLSLIPFLEHPPRISPSGSPRVAIFIPGIHTDAYWIDEAAHQVELWSTPVRIVKVKDKGSSLFTLITQIGTKKRKTDVIEQILHIMIDNRDAEFSLVCHSVGSSYAADILPRIRRRFKYIIFLGSVCHRKHAALLSGYCEKLINHRGVRDELPIIANAINGLKYSATGTVGFNQGVHVTDLAFDNDHASCTQRPHIEGFVIPQLQGLKLERPRNLPSTYSTMTVRFIWYVTGCVAIISAALAIWLQFWVALIVPFVCLATSLRFIRFFASGLKRVLPRLV